MRPLSAANIAALQARTIMPRDFLWLTARDRDTGASVSEGYWSDVGYISAQIINPDTGLAQTRDWFGAAQLVETGPVAMVSNLTVQTLTIRMSQIDDRISDIVRGYDLKQGRVELYRGLLNISTRKLVAPAFHRFVGTVDEVEIVTPEEGGEGSVTLTAMSSTNELGRSNPDTRTDASQRRRSATDNFYQDTAVVGSWEMFWGGKSVKR